jgi:hypothetical protein
MFFGGRGGVDCVRFGMVSFLMPGCVGRASTPASKAPSAWQGKAARRIWWIRTAKGQSERGGAFPAFGSTSRNETAGLLAIEFRKTAHR